MALAAATAAMAAAAATAGGGRWRRVAGDGGREGGRRVGGRTESQSRNLRPMGEYDPGRYDYGRTATPKSWFANFFYGLWDCYVANLGSQSTIAILQSLQYRGSLKINWGSKVVFLVNLYDFRVLGGPSDAQTCHMHRCGHSMHRFKHQGTLLLVFQISNC